MEDKIYEAVRSKYGYTDEAEQILDWFADLCVDSDIYKNLYEPKLSGRK